jgi:exopolysaccharide production protein ExoQ
LQYPQTDLESLMDTTFQRVALFVLLLMATGGGVGIYLGQESTSLSSYASTSGNLVIQFAFSLLYLFFLRLMLLRYKSALLLIRREIWVIALCLFALISTAWSLDPGMTLRRGLALLGTTLVGAYMGLRMEIKQQLRFVAGCIGATAIASLLVCIAIPGIGIAAAGEWQGVFEVKNVLGRMMALGVLCFAVLAIGNRRRRWSCVAMMALCFSLLLLSRSATAAVVCVSILCILPFRKVLNLSPRSLIPVLAVWLMVAVPVTFWVQEHSDALFDVLGRSSSLTGRLPLWHYVKEEILDRPILGYGYSSFWTSPEGDRIRDLIGWEAPHAHNGFLETALGLGFIGAALLVAGMWKNLALGFATARAGTEIEDFWPLLYLIFTVLSNLTESSLLAANSFLWMIYVANAFWLTRTELCAQEQNQDDSEQADSEARDFLDYEPARS